MILFSTSALSVSVIRCRRSEESPTCSGLALGRLWAWTATALMRHSRAASSMTFTFMTLILPIEVSSAAAPQDCAIDRRRPRASRYQRGRTASSEAGGSQVLANLDKFLPGQYPALRGGAVAQLGEHKAGSLGVRGSSPLSSTNSLRGVTASAVAPLLSSVAPGLRPVASNRSTAALLAPGIKCP